MSQVHLIEREYDRVKNTPSDINQHIPVLYTYAAQSKTVLECGARTCISTWAFIKGLLDNGQEQKKLVSIDIDDCPQAEVVKRIASQSIDYCFWKGNDLNYSGDEKFDLVFIDTWHVYGQLKRELEKFASMTNKWIIMHDTTIDEIVGESVRMNMDIELQRRQSGYSKLEIITGLWPAIEEFLENHPEFIIKKRFTNNNGLTILERIKVPLIK